MIFNTRAVVLNHLRYGDSNLIVNLYTECSGRQTVFVKGASGKKSQMPAALFQPLHLVETGLHHRNNRQMQRISNVQMSYPFRSIPFDPVKSCIALFIAEILYKTLREEESNPGLFDFLLHAIQALDLNDSGTANFHLIFLVHYSRYLGFQPNAEQFAESMRFDSQKVTFSSPPGGSPPAEYNRFLTQLLGLSFEHLNDLQINHLQRNYLTEHLLNYYSLHVDNFGKIKSFPVLRSVFQD